MSINDTNKHLDWIRRAMRDCPTCRQLEEPMRTDRAMEIRGEIVATQGRPPITLPSHVWPNGRPFAETTPKGTLK
jgi:hypothetical protein